jgi:proteic killer suppression protein
MILGFADEGTADLFHGVRSREARRALPPELWRVARRKLDRLDAAGDPRDLADPPGNRLEVLRGDLAGLFSLRVNDRYLIVFRFERGDASEVRVVDYH